MLHATRADAGIRLSKLSHWEGVTADESAASRAPRSSATVSTRRAPPDSLPIDSLLLKFMVLPRSVINTPDFQTVLHFSARNGVSSVVIGLRGLVP